MVRYRIASHMKHDYWFAASCAAPLFKSRTFEEANPSRFCFDLLDKINAELMNELERKGINIAELIRMQKINKKRLMG